MNNGGTKEIEFSDKMLRAMIIPLIFEQALNSSVGILDSLMVSFVGEAAVSAVSLVDCINILLVQSLTALAAGGAIVAGQFIGSKDNDKACKAGQQLILSLVFFAFIVMAGLYFLEDYLFQVVFGSITAEVDAYARSYFTYIIASVPFIALYSSGAALFRIMGNSKISMAVALLMNIVNTVGNSIFLFSIDMGVAGIAIATLIARMTAAIIIIALLFNQKYEVHLSHKTRWTIDVRMICRIMSIGVPNGMETALFQLGKVVTLSLVSSFGIASIAANAIGYNVIMYQIIGGQAVGIAMVTVVSQCVGANDYGKARMYTRKLIKTAYGLIIGMSVVTMLLLPLVLWIYNVSPEANMMTIQILVLHSVCACLIWPFTFALPNALRAAGDTKYTMIVSGASTWIVRVGFSFLLGGFLGFGLIGTWIAMVLDWMVRAPLILWRYRGHKWEHRYSD